MQKARWWFDNMTMYLDTLLDAQQDLGEEILAILDTVIEKVQTDVAVSATLLVDACSGSGMKQQTSNYYDTIR